MVFFYTVNTIQAQDSGGDYYVSRWGDDDTCVSTPDDPWAALQKAIDN